MAKHIGPVMFLDDGVVGWWGGGVVGWWGGGGMVGWAANFFGLTSNLEFLF